MSINVRDDGETNEPDPQPHGVLTFQPGGKQDDKGCSIDEFKRRMRELVSRDETLDFLRECLDGKHGPEVFMSAMEFASDRGYGAGT